jgi:hypothetical protein
MERAMHDFDRDTAFRRVLRRVLALLGVSALILAAGLDHADAATAIEPLKTAATAAMSWLAVACLGIALFTVYRRTVPSRARRAAIARRRAAARGIRHRPF